MLAPQPDNILDNFANTFMNFVLDQGQNAIMTYVLATTGQQVRLLRLRSILRPRTESLVLKSFFRHTKLDMQFDVAISTPIRRPCSDVYVGIGVWSRRLANTD